MYCTILWCSEDCDDGRKIDELADKYCRNGQGDPKIGLPSLSHLSRADAGDIAFSFKEKSHAIDFLKEALDLDSIVGARILQWQREV